MFQVKHTVCKRNGENEANNRTSWLEITGAGFRALRLSSLTAFNHMSDRWQRLSSAEMIDTHGEKKKKHSSPRGNRSVPGLSSDAIKEFPVQDLTAVLEAL